MTAAVRQPRAHAFTLIELVVVIVILGIAAAAIAPRFVGGSARSAEVSALGVRDLISAVATRSVLTGLPLRASRTFVSSAVTFLTPAVTCGSI